MVAIHSKMDARCCRGTRSESPHDADSHAFFDMGVVVDATGANGSGLAFFAVSPQVRAEVVHQRIIGRGSSRIKIGALPSL